MMDWPLQGHGVVEEEQGGMEESWKEGGGGKWRAATGTVMDSAHRGTWPHPELRSHPEPATRKAWAEAVQPPAPPSRVWGTGIRVYGSGGLGR